MNVYFNQSFWNRRCDGPIGSAEKVDWEFTYGHEQYYISRIYKFQEGVTLDIISLLDTAKLKDLIREYESRVGSMSEEELHYLESINSIQEFPLKKVYINNELAEMKGSCSSCYMAGRAESEQDSVLKEIQRENDFLQGKDISFQCMRVHIKYLEESQGNIESIKFITYKTEEFLPIRKHFSIAVPNGDKEYREEFVHPLTGITHRIYINEVKQENARELFTKHDSNNPYNFAVMCYELEPPLAEDERLFLMEITQSDEVNASADNKAASAMGVIFSNTGNKLGKHGYALQSFSTKMYWKSLKDVNISIAGIYKDTFLEEEILVYKYKQED